MIVPINTKVPTLALYKRQKPLTSIDGLGSWIIREWTGSPYSHAEIVIGGLWYSSSIQDGSKVRVKEIQYDPDHWDLIPMPWLPKETVIDFFLKTINQPYGWIDLFLQQFMRIHLDGRGYLCSGWCAAAIGLTQDHDSYWPEQLGNICKWRSA
jgi:hypothetical protein